MRPFTNNLTNKVYEISLKVQYQLQTLIYQDCLCLSHSIPQWDFCSNFSDKACRATTANKGNHHFGLRLISNDGCTTLNTAKFEVLCQKQKLEKLKSSAQMYNIRLNLLFVDLSFLSPPKPHFFTFCLENDMKYKVKTSDQRCHFDLN